MRAKQARSHQCPSQGLEFQRARRPPEILVYQIFAFCFSDASPNLDLLFYAGKWGAGKDIDVQIVWLYLINKLRLSWAKT